MSPYPRASVRCLLLERRVKMGKFKLAVFATLIAAGVLATAALASTKTSTIALKSTAVGKVLVGANGRTLYLFTADKGTKSACYGQCASYWPPLIAGKPTAGTGLNASMLGTTKRKDGKLQVTYHGHPLYFFLPDKKAGDVKGQGYVHFGGTWWVVSAAGAKITTKP
jgi:predicted lipoprotein with Yx(FWY)xxD motif